MSRFLVTYGPKPQIWSQSCRASTRLVTHIHGTLRPQDIQQVERTHVCGPGPWDSTADPYLGEPGGAAASRRAGGAAP